MVRVISFKVKLVIKGNKSNAALYLSQMYKVESKSQRKLLTKKWEIKPRKPTFTVMERGGLLPWDDRRGRGLMTIITV